MLLTTAICLAVFCSLLFCGVVWWIPMLVGTVLSAGVSAGLGAASQPNQPDLARSSREAAEAEALTLPGRRAVEAAARLGIPVDYPTGRQTTVWTYRVPKKRDPLSGKVLSYETVQRSQPWLNAPEGTINEGKSTQAEMAHADFTGSGDIQTQAQQADAAAKLELDLSRRFGAQFIDTALEQQRLADPEGTDARQRLAEMLLADQPEPERPVAATLDRQIGAELGAGRGLTEDERALLDQAMAQRAALGDAPAADMSQALTTGSTGQGRLNARQRKSAAWLASGATPEDVDYRRRQQDMANLGAFTAGTSPVTQFSQLSGAQTGATPNLRGPGLPNVQPGLPTALADQAVQNYSTATRLAANQVSPWYAGLSTALRGAGAAGAAGWQPFKRT